VIVAHLVKFPTFYGTRKLITVFRWASHWSLSRARCIQSTTSYTDYLRYIWILSSHPSRVLPSVLQHTDFPTKSLQAFSSFPYVLHAPHISYSFIWLSWKHSRNNKNNAASHYALSCQGLIFPLPKVKIFSSVRHHLHCKNRYTCTFISLHRY